MAAEPKHKKMYANSPTLSSDENGKKYIKKNNPTPAEKKSAQVSDGTDGIQEHEKTMKDMSDRHAKERFDLYQKHESEHLDVALKVRGNPGGDDMINKVEKDKKE